MKNQDVKKGGRFWIRNDFLRKYTRNLSIYDIGVYFSLISHCHAYKESPDVGITFVSCRTIGRELNINKDTARKSLKNLELSGLVRQLPRNKGEVSHKLVSSVPFQWQLLSDQHGHKELKKEYIKKEISTEYHGREKTLEALRKSNPDAFNKMYGSQNKF